MPLIPGSATPSLEGRPRTRGAPADVTGEIVVDVLVVDDQPAIRRALAAVLAPLRCRVVEAASGADALLRLVDGEFAVVLLDVVLPGLSGFDVAELVRQRDRTASTPIVFLTGRGADDDLVERAYRIGAVDFLAKPLIPQVVRAKVAVFAELFRQKKRIEDQAARLVEATRRENDVRVVELRLASERRFRSLADAMPQIICVTRFDGTLAYANRRWFAYTGLGVEETSWKRAVHPEDLPELQATCDAAARSRSAWELELRLRRADGVHRWHLARAVPETEAMPGATAAVSWIGTFTDIDDQKRAYREAREAVAARDEFISVASHELRTPISSLQLQVDMLLAEARAAPSVVVPNSKLLLAARQIHRLDRLVTELLEISRIAARRFRLEREPCDLAEVARDAASRLVANAERAGSTMTVHADEGIDGLWDRSRIEQIVTNLLTNAIKFGAGAPIELTVDRDGEAARIVVRDRGIGIAAPDVERIFQPFERAVPARAYGGLGLGLFIVRQIVEAHGGTIAVTSEPPRGSTFTVRLPVQVSA